MYLFGKYVLTEMHRLHEQQAEQIKFHSSLRAHARNWTGKNRIVLGKKDILFHNSSRCQIDRREKGKTDWSMNKNKFSMRVHAKN